MKDIFKDLSNTNSDIEGEFIAEMLNRVSESKKQIDSKLDKLSTQFDSKDLIQLYILFNNFAAANEITEYILIKLYDYFLDNSAKLISTSPFAVNLILDLFSHNTVIFKINKARNRVFIEKTFPLLREDIEREQGSDRDVATYRFLNLLAYNELFENGQSVLKKFISGHPDHPYIDDAREILSEIN